MENILKNDKEIPLFIKLDFYKYFAYKKISVDYSFLFNLKIRERKEAKVYCMLVTNLVQDPPFNLSPLKNILFRLKDEGLVTFQDVSEFDFNMAIRNEK